MSENEVTEVMSRVLGTESVEAPALDRRLPSADLLNRPAANLLLTVAHSQQGNRINVVVLALFLTQLPFEIADTPVLSSIAKSNVGYKVLLEASNQPPLSLLYGSDSGIYGTSR